MLRLSKSPLIKHCTRSLLASSICKIRRSLSRDAFDLIHGNEYDFDLRTPNAITVESEYSRKIEHNNEIFDMDQIAEEPFTNEQADVLRADVKDCDVEVEKVDGGLYLPVSKYIKILNEAFGHGGWQVLPANNYKYDQGSNIVYQDFRLFIKGNCSSERRVSVSVVKKSVNEAVEELYNVGVTQLCKSIGVAPNIDDPNFVADWSKRNVVEVNCSHPSMGDCKMYRRSDRQLNSYPFKETHIIKAAEEPSFTLPKDEVAISIEDDHAQGTVPDYLSESHDIGESPNFTPPPKTKKKSEHVLEVDLDREIGFGKYKGKSWRASYKEDGEKFEKYLVFMSNLADGFIPKVCKRALELLKQ